MFHTNPFPGLFFSSFPDRRRSVRLAFKQRPPCDRRLLQGPPPPLIKSSPGWCSPLKLFPLVSLRRIEPLGSGWGKETSRWPTSRRIRRIRSATAKDGCRSTAVSSSVLSEQSGVCQMTGVIKVLPTVQKKSKSSISVLVSSDSKSFESVLLQILKIEIYNQKERKKWKKQSFYIYSITKTQNINMKAACANVQTWNSG